MPLKQDEIEKKAEELHNILLQFLNLPSEQQITPEELINQIERRYSVKIINAKYRYKPRKNELQVYVDALGSTFKCNFAEKQRTVLTELSAATQQYIRDITTNQNYMEDHSYSVEIQENKPVADILKQAARLEITLPYYVEDFADQAAVLKYFLEANSEFTNLSEQQAENLNRLYAGLVCAYEKARSFAEMQLQLSSPTEDLEQTINPEEKSGREEDQSLLYSTNTSNYVDSELEQSVFNETLRKKLGTYSLSTAMSSTIHKSDYVTVGTAGLAVGATVLTSGLGVGLGFIICAPSIFVSTVARIIDLPLRAMPGYQKRYDLYVDMILKMVLQNKVDNASFKRRLEVGRSEFYNTKDTLTEEDSTFPVRNEDMGPIKKAVNDLIRHGITKPELRLHLLENMLTPTQYVCALMDFKQSYHNPKLHIFIDRGVFSPKEARYVDSYGDTTREGIEKEARYNDPYRGTTREGIKNEIETAKCQVIDRVLTEPGTLNLHENIKKQLLEYKKNLCIEILESALNKYKESSSYKNSNRENSIQNIESAIKEMQEGRKDLKQLLSDVSTEMQTIMSNCKEGSYLFSHSSKLHYNLNNAVKYIKKMFPSAAVISEYTESIEGKHIELASIKPA